nr:type II toxin-antitoxin system MqsR family toxin [Burkholderia territorii]
MANGKNAPHCKLSRVKTLIETGNVRLTTSAVLGARQPGFTEADAIGVVMSLDTVDFHKSMTTYADHTIWQDVYRRRTVNGDVYLKLTVIDDVPIVSFKER